MEKPDTEPINYLKAAVPLLPVSLLFLSGPPLRWLTVPREWLVDMNNPRDAIAFSSRLIGAAMLVGVVVAALTSRKTSLETATAFFDGTGYAFTRIISVIVAANCFGEGIRLVGVAALIGQLVEALPALLLPIAGVLPMGFAWLCGSGMASTQSVFGFFVPPAEALHIDPVEIGALVSIASSAGRTMSPVAAVTLMSATFAEAPPLDLVRRVALPVLVGMTGVVIAAMMLAK